MDKLALYKQRLAIEDLARSYARRDEARLDAEILSCQHAVVDRLRALVTRLEAEEARS
jgi:hypothetical protein